MVFEVTKTFVVRAPPVSVWDFLADTPRVVRCLPGAAIDDRGEVTVRSLVPNHDGDADLEMTSTITELAPHITKVTLASRVTVSGPLVELEQDAVDGALEDMFETFSARVRAELEPASSSANARAAATPEPPLSQSGSLAPGPFDLREAWRGTVHTVTDAAFWVAVIAIAAVLYLLFR